MPKLKYIIFHDSDGVPFPVLFAAGLEHRKIALEVSKLGLTPVSAGFASLYVSETVRHAEFIASGKSSSLNLASQPSDAEVLNTLI